MFWFLFLHNAAIVRGTDYILSNKVSVLKSVFTFHLVLQT